MIEIKKDKKSADSYIVTKTDSEGFHHQLSLTREEMLMLYSEIRKTVFA